MIEQKHALHPTANKLFAGRSMVVSSMHGKHLVMRPLLKQYLDVDTIIVPEIDTDMFGTFSGEVERPFDAATTLRKKILKGLEVSGQTLGIGNEGSFGPHHHVPFLQVDQELVMLIDLKNNLEISECTVSTKTNHFEKELLSMKDLYDFTEKARFPSHGIILKQLDGDRVVKMQKGIISWEQLYAVWVGFTKNGYRVKAETDMRGYMNPTRMAVIENATTRLMQKVVNSCPNCQCPGFGVVAVETGLPCGQCGQSSGLVKAKIYQCKQCCFTDTRRESKPCDPQYCNFCNP